MKEVFQIIFLNAQKNRIFSLYSVNFNCFTTEKHILQFSVTQNRNIPPRWRRKFALHAEDRDSISGLDRPKYLKQVHVVAVPLSKKLGSSYDWDRSSTAWYTVCFKRRLVLHHYNEIAMSVLFQRWSRYSVMNYSNDLLMAFNTPRAGFIRTLRLVLLEGLYSIHTMNA